MIKKTFSLLLITAVGLNCLITTPSYAEDFALDDTSANVSTSFTLDNSFVIERISENEYQVNDGGYSGFISITDNDTERIVTIKDKETNEENFIKLDKSSGLIFSSFTNSTVNINSNEITNNLTDASLFSSTKPPHNPMISYETKYISYAQIRNITGEAANAGQVAASILFFIPGCAWTAGAIGSVSTIVNLTLARMIPNDSYHGIRLTVKKEKYYRKRMGNWGIHRINQTIIDATTY